MLEHAQIVAYITALALAAVIPGPGMTALLARTAASGAATGFAMLLGLILGDLAYLSLAVFGLAALAKSFGIIFLLVKWCAAFYLCYLAWSFWHADYQQLNATPVSHRKALLSAGVSGFTVTMANPKTIAFYLALLPVVIDIESVTLKSWAGVLVPLTALVLVVVGGIFIWCAMGVRKTLSSAKAQKVVYRGAAGAMVAAAGAMIVKES